MTTLSNVARAGSLPRSYVRVVAARLIYVERASRAERYQAVAVRVAATAWHYLAGPVDDVTPTEVSPYENPTRPPASH